MRRLLRKGLPLSVCVAYMLAGPIINVVVILSTYVAFTNNSMFGGPWPVVGLRVGLAFVTAFVTALIVERQYQKHGNALLSDMVVRGLNSAKADDDAGPRKRSLFERLNNISATALGDFIDIMAFLILGASLAAAGRVVIDNLTRPQPALNADVAVVTFKDAPHLKVTKVFGSDDDGLKVGDIILQVGPKEVNSLESLEAALTGKKPAENVAVMVRRDQEVEVESRLGIRREVSSFVTLVENNVVVAILLMMGIAVVFCLCSEADAFVAANFTVIWPAAAKLAFLVLGPMMDIKLYLMYTRIFRRRLIWTIALSVATQVLVYCLIVHYVTLWYFPAANAVSISR